MINRNNLQGLLMPGMSFQQAEIAWYRHGEALYQANSYRSPWTRTKVRESPPRQETWVPVFSVVAAAWDPKDTRVPQTRQIYDFELAHEPSLAGSSKQGFTGSAHTYRRPSNIRRLSPAMITSRLDREAHGGICCVDGNIWHWTENGRKLHQAARCGLNAEFIPSEISCAPERAYQGWC